jgi:subtilisin family serine protease
MKNRLGWLLLLVCSALAFSLARGQARQIPAEITIQQPGTEKFVSHGARAIPNQYIVVLDQDAPGPRGQIAEAAGRADALLQSLGRSPSHVYGHAIAGFAAQMTEAEALLLSQDPRVRFVEEDSVMEAIVTQSNPPWGLDRIDERDLPLSASYTYTATGANVNAYIIDTGIRRSHSQFGGRAAIGFDAIGDGRNTSDCHGHGTHVAGTVGGSTYGVAKAVRLYAVRVLSCSGSGSTSGVIAGVDWVTANHNRPAVANMSLGGGPSSALDMAVRNSIAAGVTYSIAAGNSNRNASTASPARVSEAITVGSSTRTDARSSFSNFGSVVDVFAPGSSIPSAWYTSDTATATLSGTSMAAPHVAGVAARILQGAPGSSPAQVRNLIVNNATTNRLSGIPSGTANRLLFRSGTQ